MVAAAAALSGCGKPSEPAGAATGAGASAAVQPCPDDGGRLALTGLCAGRAVNVLNVVEYDRRLREDCTWVVGETPFADDVLLYRAARCPDGTAKLDYAGGAQMAELTEATNYSHSIKVVPIDGGDAQATILRIARAAIPDAAERARCKIRTETIFGPPDALVVDDVSPGDAVQPEQDGPRSACGPFGYNGDESSYWRVFQGYVWFFQMGQEGAYVDPGSLTLMRKGPDGAWSQVE